MNKSIRSFKQGAQAGFTLIELVVVIVILGILAATAIPKFADMATDARVAKMNAARGSVQAASAMFHAQALTSGVASGTSLTMDNVAVTNVNGYAEASAAGIVSAAGNLADYVMAYTTAAPATVTITPDTNHARCSLIYTAAVATVTGTAPNTVTTVAPPTINAANITSDNCR